MSFRRRLLFLFSLLVLVSVAAVAVIVSVMVRRAFDRATDERTAALVAQFHREFNHRGEEVARRIAAAAATPEVARMAVAVAQKNPNYNSFLDDAQIVAQTQGLDFLELCDSEGTIISSAQWPAKFGYKEPLVHAPPTASAFMKEEETPAGSALGLFAIRSSPAGDGRLYVIGGVRLDSSFLASLDPPPGMRVLLYENLRGGSSGFSASNLVSADSLPGSAEQLRPLISEVEGHSHDASRIVHWNSGTEEAVNAFPLLGENHELLAILLVASSRQIYADLRREIRSAALLAAGAGLLLAILLSSWAAARMTRPLEQLAVAAAELAHGNWEPKIDVNSKDEVGALAGAFNQMAAELREQRESLVQAERVAAWRELARRLAHELKNPLFPLQLTVESLLRSREAGRQQFDETFQESAGTLLSEIDNLKKIIGRFSEFSKMPQPQLQAIKLDQIIEDTIKAHRAQMDAANIRCRSEVSLPGEIAADPDLLHRALSNLMTNAIDAMPHGGTIVVRARLEDGRVRIQLSDTGVGLTSEECSRLFTPYYTTKTTGTGLGLAIVQSIVSDHGGSISVSSEAGRGTTFTIDLPLNPDKLTPMKQAAQI